MYHQLFADLDPLPAGTLDGLMVASGTGVFAVDLRALSAADADAVRAANQHRATGLYGEVDATVAFDAIIHIPHTTAAHVDLAAVRCAPPEVRAALTATDRPARTCPSTSAVDRSRERAAHGGSCAAPLWLFLSPRDRS
ncbi:MAG TPA: hypothetical protein VGN81_20905 [Pseudonocardiaceae bacterium]